MPVLRYGFRRDRRAGGGRFATADALAAAVAACWPAGGRRFVVLTGGEPLLQVDAALIAALHEQDFEIAVETNGTIAPPAGLDWVCVSPKAGAALAATAGDELKLVFPQDHAAPADFETLDFAHFLLSPMDGPTYAQNRADAVAYCLAHPQWRLTLQTHKMIGIA